MMAKIRDIEVDVKTPEGQWDGNENCPFCNSLRVRGQIIEGKVSAVGMDSSIILERETTRYMPKYVENVRRGLTVTLHIFHLALGRVPSRKGCVSWNADRSPRLSSSALSRRGLVMKGISSSVTNALPTQAKMDCVDNTGAKIVQLMNVLPQRWSSANIPPQELAMI